MRLYSAVLCGGIAASFPAFAEGDIEAGEKVMASSDVPREASRTSNMGKVS